jgi:hypothetical protein
LLISFLLALFSIPWMSLAGKARLNDGDDGLDAQTTSGSKA